MIDGDDLFIWDTRNTRPWKETQEDKVPERYQETQLSL